VMILATWFGSGYSPVAPGTAGTLAAIPFYLLLSPLPIVPYLSLTILFIIVSSLVASRADLITGCHDPKIVVIDEVAGYLVTMTGVDPTPRTIVIGFFLFRFFDVLKPFPANVIDARVPGGAGVVLDDVAAGIYAAVALHLLARWV